MRLAMHLAALCDIYRGRNGTNGCHLTAFSLNVAFAHHFVVTHPPPPSHPIEVLVVLAIPVKHYLKWQVVKLHIHSIVG